MSWGFVVRGEASESVEIDIYDVIGDSFWSDSVSPKDVRRTLKNNRDAKIIKLRINSAGGDVTDGIAIYNLLAEHPARKEVDIDGLAASMASVIAMVGDEIRVAENAFVMIHNPWAMSIGDSSEMRKTADLLDKMRDSLAGTYAKRTGQSKEDVLAAMDAETWMTAEEALALGYADTITPAKQKLAASLDLSRFNKTPAALKALAHAALTQEPAKQEIPAQPSPQPAQEPEVIAMSEPIKNTNDSATPSVARALGLAPGSSEQDMLAAATRTRELELQVIAITGAPSSAEALGAVRALKAKADGYDKLSDEVNQLRAERDKQNFETQVVRGRSEGKLSVAEEKFEREKFDRKVAEGRGAEAVAELKGFLDVAATRVVARVTQPAPDAAGSSVPLTYNGKSYRNMTGTERARLSRENNELYKAMRGEWIAAGQPQPENSAA